MRLLATLEDPRVVWCRSSPIPPIHLPPQQTSSRTRSPDPQSVGLSSAVGLDTPADAAVCLRPCAALSVAFFRCSWRGVSPSLRTSVVLSLTALLIVAGCSRSPEAKKARHLERGDRYFSKEQYREAILEYRNVLQIERTNPVAIRQIGLAHYQLGEPGQAFGFLLKSKELDPNNIEVRLKLGTMYLVARQQDRAHEEAAFLVEKDPKSLDALALLAGAANEPKEVDAAIRRLEAAQGELGKRTKLQLALAGLHLRKRDLAGAERALKEAVTAEPKSFEAHLALGEFYARKRDLPQAEREFKEASGLAPVGSPARVQLADLYLLVGKPDEAKKLLGEATQKTPDYLPAWRRLAEIAFAEGKLEDGAKALEAVLKKNPQDLDGLLLRGRLHLAKAETTQAIQDFQQVLK